MGVNVVPYHSTWNGKQCIQGFEDELNVIPLQKYQSIHGYSARTGSSLKEGNNDYFDRPPYCPCGYFLIY